MGTLIFQQIHYFNKIATWSSLPLTTSNLVKFLWPKCQRDRAAGGGEWRPRRPVGAGPLGMGQPRRGPDRQGRSDARAGGLSGKEGTSCGSTRVAGSGPGRHQGQTAQWRPSCCLLFLCPLPQDGGLQQVVTRQGQQRETLPAGVSLKTLHSCGNPTGELSPSESIKTFVSLVNLSNSTYCNLNNYSWTSLFFCL